MQTTIEILQSLYDSGIDFQIVFQAGALTCVAWQVVRDGFREEGYASTLEEAMTQTAEAGRRILFSLFSLGSRSAAGINSAAHSA